MPQAETVGGIASTFGDFLQGVMGGKAQAYERETAERGERTARVAQLFSTAEKMRQDALKGDLIGPARDKLFEQSKSLFSSAMALSGQLDDKPAKAGKKQNPFMQFLSMMNPYSDSSKEPGAFDENFNKIVTAMGPGMGMGQDAGGTGAPGAEAAPGAPGAASAGLGAMVSPATAGGPVGGFSSATEGEVGGMTAAPTAAVPATAVPGAAAPGAVPGAVPGAAGPGPGGLPAALGVAAGEDPYVSEYFTPDEAVVERQKFAHLTQLYTAMRATFAAKGITTVEGLRDYPEGREIVQHLMFLAASDDFDGFDELDEVYAGLGLQEARTPKNQFEDDYFRLARRAAGEGEPLNDREQQQFAAYRRIRRAGTDRVLSPADQMFEDSKRRNTNEAGEIDMQTAFSEWTTLTAKSGTQGYQSKTGINPSTGRTEVMMVNNRDGTINWPGIEVPSDFTFDKIMTRNPYGQGSYMDSGKIRFYYDRGDFSYEALNWFLQDMPPMALDPIFDKPIPNPEREKLERFIESLPDPSTIATIREFVTGWNSDPANAAPERQISFEEARDKMRSLGLPIGGSAIAAWRDAREEGG